MIKDVYKTKENINESITNDKLNELIEKIKECYKDNVINIYIQEEHKIYIKLNYQLRHNVWDNYKLFDDIIKDWLGNDGIEHVYLLYDLYIISNNECIIEI